jgi:signal recognition particle subunit SRP54
VGEGLEEFEEFDPVKFVSRLLGRPDLESIVARIQQMSKEERLRMQKMAQGKFTIEEFIQQLESVRKIGDLQSFISNIPGGKKLDKKDLEEFMEKLKKWKAIVSSMNMEERSDVTIIDSSRIRRIARGSGTSEKDVRELVKQYTATKKAIRKMSKGALRKLPYLRF